MNCDKTGIMLRRVLHRQSERHRAVQDEVNEGSSTPRRGSYSEIPRIRLLDKQAKLVSCLRSISFVENRWTLLGFLRALRLFKGQGTCRIETPSLPQLFDEFFGF